MTKQITINLFKVSRTDETPPLSDTLEEFAALLLENRWRSDVRLDKVSREKEDKILPLEAFHLNFAKLRDVGPGKMGKDSEVSDIGLEKDEWFGEETTVLYVPQKQWLLVLNNHYGVGVSRMASYFNSLDPGNTEQPFRYTIAPQIDQNALKKMMATERLGNIEVVANIGAFANSEVVGTSVYTAASSVSAQSLSLKLCAHELRRRGGVLRWETVLAFLDMLRKNPEEISTLKVTLEERMDAQDKVIDLLEQKIHRKYTDKDLTVQNHRYTYDSKIYLLRKTCGYWHKTLT